MAKHDNSKNVSDTVLVRLNNRAEYMRRMKELIRSGNKFVIKHVRALAVNTKEVFELVDEVPLRTKLLLLAELPGDIHSYHHVVHEGLEDDDTGTVMLCYRVIRKHKEMTNDELFTRRVLKSILVNVRREESFYECVHLLIGLLRGVRVDRRDVLRVMHIVNDRMNTVNKRFRERIGTLYCCMGRWVDVRSVVNLMMDNLRVCDRVQRVMGVVVLSKMGVRYFCEVVAVLLMDYGMREFNVKVGVIRVLERIVKYYVGRYCGVTHHDMGRYSTNYCNMVCSNADNYRYALHKYGNCEQRGSGKICDIARHKCIKNEKYKRYLRAHEITAKTYAIEDKKRRAKNRKYVRVSSKLIKYIIPVLNNALTQNDKTLRKCALQLLKHVLHLHITTEHLIHLFNISFVNLLCDDEIKDVFDECFVLFVRKLSSNYVFKYLVSGLEHPSHSVRERYVELLAMVQRNGVLIESVDDDEFIDSVF
ncbi:hypothetical protein VCUG_01700 [Vavraia culicis subsp. floridensis]|uniref:Uncharacterized protein n=1 Tax=Vavraia culicis (isolate floridensis) TaxID=948595 RepID=L2GUM2_VAVCU|nr:uncharacterized protein VCUG_01700 [Vavraia culicis subsp. floridensis]ELA46800.2 hypothetical protein VCUG_01700 [Vavraia culicis subsp. floridensis]